MVTYALPCKTCGTLLSAAIVSNVGYSSLHRITKNIIKNAETISLDFVFFFTCASSPMYLPNTQEYNGICMEHTCELDITLHSCFEL